MKYFFLFIFIFSINIYSFAQNNYGKNINLAISYLGEPIPNGFEELDRTIYTNIDGFYNDIYIYTYDPFALFTKNNIVTAVYIFNFIQNKNDTIMLLEEYNNFLIGQGWILSDKKIGSSVNVYTKNGFIIFIDHELSKFKDETVFAIIITNEFSIEYM